MWDMLNLFDLVWWHAVLIGVSLTTPITILAVTLYLHRSEAHQALKLHPVVSHFFRFWLWLTTGMDTKEWVAIHRKHHAFPDKDEDPHSPYNVGVKTVLFRGVTLYRREAKNPDTLETYGHGAPDDWIERHLYRPYRNWGTFGVLPIVDLLCFGLSGIAVWSIQMIWIPFFAAGVINGLGHWWGYRNHRTPDGSKNIVPWGILIGGEELHNNHHREPLSARFSHRWWEIDVGWWCIKALSAARLAWDIKRIPLLRIDRSRRNVDKHTVEMLRRERDRILAYFERKTRRVCPEIEEIRKCLYRIAEECTRKSWEEVQREVQHWTWKAEQSGVRSVQRFARRLPQLVVA